MTSLTIQILRSLVPAARKIYYKNRAKTIKVEDALRNIDRAIAGSNKKPLPMQKMEKVEIQKRTPFNRAYRTFVKGTRKPGPARRHFSKGKETRKVFYRTVTDNKRYSERPLDHLGQKSQSWRMVLPNNSSDPLSRHAATARKAKAVMLRLRKLGKKK